MKFWDASALILLCVAQEGSQRAMAWHQEDPDVAAWWLAPVECASALHRLARAGTLTREAEGRAAGLLTALSSAWHEVLPTEAVRQRALRALRVHPLRAADATQLAAALVWAEDNPTGATFLTGDKRLAEAARREGFAVLDPQAGHGE